MKNIFAWSLLIFLFTVGFSQNSLRFPVMADWGGSSIVPSHTTTDEVRSAKAMGSACANSKCNFGVGVGDNIYLLGVSNENDKRFKETFENVFSDASLNIPFYFCAGNHDHYGNVSGEIAYTKHSSRWKFFDYNYTRIFKIPGTSKTIQLVFIDTVILTGNTVDAEYCNHPLFSEQECVIHPRGPQNIQSAEDQWKWLESVLSASKSEFLLVLGHYPVWSIAEHGPTAGLVSRLRPMLFEYNVTAYVAGHDHEFEYLEEKNRASDVGYIQAGGTHECTIFREDHIDKVPKGSLKWHGCDDGGFVMIDVTQTALTATYINGRGEKSFSTSLGPRPGL